jgi:DNA-binding response OmpR family regulator
MSRILIVEDEQHIAEGLRFNLVAERHDVEVVDTGEAALALVAANPTRFELVILDVMLPGIDGFAVVAKFRRDGQFVPVLMLTARGRPEDVLGGLEAGADDYLPKPFELPILIARVQGLLRRREWFRLGLNSGTAAPASASPSRFTFRERTLDFDQLEVRVGDKTLPLTLMEASLLRYLVEHEGRPVSRKMILENVWNVHEDTDTRAIDNFIVRLRRYLEDEPASPRHLQTVRGVGYRFVANPD